MVDATFAPPGPGFWSLDRSHYYTSATPIARSMQSEPMERGMRRVFEELGVPAATLRSEFVEGYNYSRLVPLIGGDKPPKKLPPAIVLKIMSRLHPGMRARTATAAKVMRDRPWRAVTEDWHRRIRPETERRNLELQDVDVAALDDAGLAGHIDELFTWGRQAFELHFWLHGYDLGPIGRLVMVCRDWGIPASDVVGALKGASPSTSAPSRALAEIRASVRAAGVTPTTLDEVRAVSPEVAEQLDTYLRYRGNLLFSKYDLDGVTLGEVPDVVLSTIMQGSEGTSEADAAAQAAAAADALRDRVPPADRASFDQALDEARAAMDLRDENGPMTVEWPMGLLRRALLEAGRRLAARGLLDDATHVFELEPTEVLTLVRAGTGPSASTVAARAARRRELASITPPPTLGEPEPQPPLDVLPKPLADNIRMVSAVLEELGMQGGPVRDRLSGTGVGTASYRGIARRADSAEAALAAMEPGDVLVVPTTTPAYNVVLSIAGAVVTAEGGPLCHAAVLARELGIPAVVGVSGALAAIPDGAEIEVDPAAGQVRVLTASPG